MSREPFHWVVFPEVLSRSELDGLHRWLTRVGRDVTRVETFWEFRAPDATPSVVPGASAEPFPMFLFVAEFGSDVTVDSTGYRVHPLLDPDEIGAYEAALGYRPAQWAYVSGWSDRGPSQARAVDRIALRLAERLGGWIQLDSAFLPLPAGREGLPLEEFPWFTPVEGRAYLATFPGEFRAIPGETSWGRPTLTPLVSPEFFRCWVGRRGLPVETFLWGFAE